MTVPGWILLRDATTLQERCFARLVAGFYGNKIAFLTNGENWQMHPLEPTTKGVLRACHENRCAAAVLNEIPITRPASSNFNDPELYPWLQDLAQLIALEAAAAFRDEFYPGMPDVFVEPEHVKKVMAAMQRELDREGLSRRKAPAVFEQLPWERQVALAERRRYWYGQYGITPEVWATGHFSLWHVAAYMPEILK